MRLMFCGVAVFSGAQAARSLRSPRLLVQRCARPGSTPIVLSCGTGRPQGGLASKAERSPSGA